MTTGEGDHLGHPVRRVEGSTIPNRPPVGGGPARGGRLGDARAYVGNQRFGVRAALGGDADSPISSRSSGKL